MQRVADREMPGIDETDDVARVRHVDRLAIATEEAVGARGPERLPDAAVEHHHVFGETARTHTDERDSVAMARIHVRLDLELETAEALIGGADGSRFGLARLR